MSTNFEDVGEFHERFEVPHLGEGKAPHALVADQFAYRFKFMLEELAEYAEAHDAPGIAVAVRELRERIDAHVEVYPPNPNRVNLAAALDALVDLGYVALGTAHFHHFPYDAAWAEVQRANMTKERGPTAKRGHALDVRKPIGFNPPNIDKVITDYVKAVSVRSRSSS